MDNNLTNTGFSVWVCVCGGEKKGGKEREKRDKRSSSNVLLPLGLLLPFISPSPTHFPLPYLFPPPPSPTHFPLPYSFPPPLLISPSPTHFPLPYSFPPPLLISPSPTHFPLPYSFPLPNFMWNSEQIWSVFFFF